MNSWLLAAVIIIVVAVVILIGCIMAVIFPLKKVVTVLLGHMERIQIQLEGIQTQAMALTTTVDKMKTDVAHKKHTLQVVVQSVKNVGTALNSLNNSAQKATTAVVKRFEQNDEMQAQVTRWTNYAVYYLNRRARH